ncbi:YpjP family protein [Bacillus sp. 179-C3.3 HS]|uniref:YpjP family protein n=1 Tax=Bacillus sp. 179-C3.3 HS TaxID=3232162 RepID=UPI0039A24145
MKMWMRKTLVALFTIATFGLISPPSALMTDKPSELSSSDQSSYTAVYDQSDEAPSWDVGQEGDIEEVDPYEQYKQEVLSSAENQSFLKFGQRITPVIEDEFREEIQPKIEQVITDFLTNFKHDEKFQEIVLTNQPASGKGERIFHIYNQKTGEDLLRFHVRRDHPPHSGYWFNFHYHTAEDGFQSHHELGNIYWDKNTPPSWMSH